MTATQPTNAWPQDAPQAGPLDAESLGVEQTYRAAFLAAARPAAGWAAPDEDAVALAWDARRRLRDPRTAGRQDDVELARRRARAQALSFARDGWHELRDAGVSDDVIRAAVITSWLAAVGRWAAEELTAGSPIEAPPTPLESLTDAQREALRRLGAERAQGAGRRAP